MVANTKPKEELYDLLEDPHELNNLASEPAYTDDLQRLRDAFNRWHQAYPDLGMIPESELLQRWRPDGVFLKTERPEIKIEAGMITATCATEGASIAWTADPPTPEQKSAAKNPLAALGKAVGNPEMDGRSWQLYNQPFEAPHGRTLWFRAHRLGYLKSEEVALDFSKHVTDT